MDTNCFIMPARIGLFAHNAKKWLADLFTNSTIFSALTVVYSLC